MFVAENARERIMKKRKTQSLAQLVKKSEQYWKRGV